jgi:membrane-bound lytic murein transglycosylase A
MAVLIKNEHCMRFTRSLAGLAGWAASITAAVLLASCGGGAIKSGYLAPPTGAPIITGQRAANRLTAVSWQQVPGWQDDSLLGATAAMRQNCSRKDSTIST